MKIVTSNSTIVKADRLRNRSIASMAIFLPIVSALLLGLCFPPTRCDWLVWIAMAPLGMVMAKRKLSLEDFLGAYLGGSLFFLVASDFLRTMDSASLLTGPRVQDWLVQSQLLALSWPVMIKTGSVVRRKTRLPITIVLPLVWIAYETSLRHFCGLIDGSGWVLCKMPHVLAHRPLVIQIADLGGHDTINLLVGIVNGFVADQVVHCWQGTLSAHGCIPTLVLAITAVASACGYGKWQLSCHQTEGPCVALIPQSIQPCIADAKDTQSIAQLHAEILLWCEGAIEKSIVDHGHGAWECYENYAREVHKMLVVGCRRRVLTEAADQLYNSCSVVDSHHGFLGCYNKIKLVPWSEQSPYHGIALTDRPCLGFTPGNSYPQFKVASRGRTYSFAVAICYDVAFPEIFRRYFNGDNPPEFFLMGSSENADRTKRIQYDLLSMARLRAVSCRRSIVRNVAGGYSGVVDSNGCLRLPVPPFRLQEPVVLPPLPIDDRFSLYCRGGFLFPYLVTALVVVVALVPTGTPSSALATNSRSGSGIRPSDRLAGD